MSKRIGLFIFAASALVPSVAFADTITVGPGKTYAKPCEAFPKAKDGDTIEIDAAGDYKGDMCAIQKNGLTIRGMGGRAKIDANGTTFAKKAAWVIVGNDTTLENIEFLNAKSTDENGAGIRQEGANLTIHNCYFHDNENGILAGDKADSSIVIEGSEFAKNGRGEGQTHNLYINHVKAFTFRFNYSHDCNIGHLVKSRAKSNLVAYNRLTDENGTASYEIDLPNAGTSYVIGNIIEQSATTDNPSMVAYGEEGISAGYGNDLYVVNNTFVNHRANGGTFVFVDNRVMTPAKLTNNIFFGKGTVSTQGSAQQGTNFGPEMDPMFVDESKFDFHLKEGSPCVDKGSAPPAIATMSLVPDFHYVHPLSHSGRKQAGAQLDIGAYELGGEGLPDPSTSSSSGASGSSGSSGSSGTSGSNASSGTLPDGGVANGAAPGDEDDGCGCHSTRASSNAVSALAMVGLALLVRSRRRSKR